MFVPLFSYYLILAHLIPVVSSYPVANYIHFISLLYTVYNIENVLWIFLLFSFFFVPHTQISPAGSSRFGSSGNLSQTSSPLSEMGQESVTSSELKESYHSFHNTGYRPPANGHHPANGHTSWGEDEVLKSSQEKGRSESSTLRKDNVPQVKKSPETSQKRFVYAWMGFAENCVFL